MNYQDRGIDFAGIRASNPIADTVGRYIELRKRGGEYIGRCPFHNDSNPSFAVVPRKEKAFCNACGWHGDVIDFVAEFESVEPSEACRRLGAGELPNDRPALPELPPDDADDWSPILPAPPTAPAYDPARTYNPRRGKAVNWKRALTRLDAYRDYDGAVLGYVVRMDIDGSKLTPTVTWCQHVDGREAWVAHKFPAPRPLQGLDELANRPTAAVLVVSGEKCRAAAAEALTGFCVVTWPGGDDNVDKADWSALYGRRVTIWPDNDESGVAASERLAADLDLVCPEVRVIDPSGQVKGWDIADAVADGWSTGDIVAWVKPRVRVWRPDPDRPDPINPGDPPARADDTRPAETGAADAELADQYRGVPGDPLPASAASFDDTRPVQIDATLLDRGAPADTLPVRFNASLDTAADPEEDGLPEMYSEDNVALRFSQIYADDLRYVAPWGRWMRWQNQRWCHEETLEVFDLSRKVCRSVAAWVRNDRELTPKQCQTVADRYGKANTVAAIERLAKADRRHAATISQWDSDIWLLNTPAGVVDLRTGIITPGDRRAYMTKITRVAPGGACPTWYRFLEVATAGDHELIGFLQRMAGYALSGSTRDHALFFVYGTGGNGKGTFLNTLQWIMGDYAKAAAMDVFTERKHESHPTELAGLMGARMVTAQETEEGKRWAEARIKALTGGDPITARFMRQDNFEFTPQFKLVIAGNHKPGLRNVDEAIKRRLHLIPFTVTIPAAERDVRLPEKLQAEAGGILQWAIEGCQQWLTGGLRAPAAVIAATDEYLEQEDQFVNWITDCCEVSALFSFAAKPLYASYKAWAERSGEYPVPQKRWAQQMVTRGFESKRTKSGVMYAGIKVNHESDSIHGYL